MTLIYDTQNNDTQHNDTEHNDTQSNNTQNIDSIIMAFRKMTLSIIFLI